MRQPLKKYAAALLAAVSGICLIAYALCLPRDLFPDTGYSTVLTDRNGNLLGARIAADGQWRFPPADSVPEKFAVAIIEFEDRWFRIHPGINPVSLARAAYRNIRAGHIVSGGSTITMQVIRLSRQKERTVRQKFIECILATRLELKYSKEEILAMYASHAPFGGNTVGLEAASWRYFGKPASELSWGETATLAVLPNAPSMIHPGKNRNLLKQKRDRLLESLLEHGKIDSSAYVLACSEPLPDSPVPMPQHAPHLLDRLMPETASGRTVRTDIDLGLQRRTAAVLEKSAGILREHGLRIRERRKSGGHPAGSAEYRKHTEAHTVLCNAAGRVTAPRDTASRHSRKHQRILAAELRPPVLRGSACGGGPRPLAECSGSTYAQGIRSAEIP